MTVGRLRRRIQHCTSPMAFPIRAAFFYVWYPTNWTAGVKVTPTIGQYDSHSQGLYAGHKLNWWVTNWCKWAHIDVLFVSWWVDSGYDTTTAITDLMNYIEREAMYDGGWPDLKVAILYDIDVTVLNPTEATIVTNLNTAEANWFNRPSYVRVRNQDGVVCPPFAVFRRAGAGTTDYRDKYINAKTTYGKPLYYLLGHYAAGLTTSAAGIDCWQHYSTVDNGNQADPDDPARYDDATNVHAGLEPGGSYTIAGAYYEDGDTPPGGPGLFINRSPSILATKAATAQTHGDDRKIDWALVTSANEAPEGTMLFPVTEDGDVPGIRGVMIDGLHNAWRQRPDRGIYRLERAR